MRRGNNNNNENLSMIKISLSFYSIGKNCYLGHESISKKVSRSNVYLLIAHDLEAMSSIKLKAFNFRKRRCAIFCNLRRHAQTCHAVNIYP